MNNMKIGEKLYNFRKEKGISQEEAANLIGVSRQIISKWEQDISVPRADNLKKICEIYNISYEDLFSKRDCDVKKQKNIKLLIIIFFAMILGEFIIILIVTFGTKTKEYKCFGLQTYYILDMYEKENDENYIYVTLKNNSDNIKTVKVSKLISSNLEKEKYYEFIFRTNEINTDIDYIFQNNEIINVIKKDYPNKNNVNNEFNCE